RDLTAELPHIIGTLGCRILQLLPIHPTPTTFARYGRFGSPYAALDLTAIDPALVVFDKRTTGVDQFCELAYATHSLGARLFLDIVLNHTGWGSTLQSQHPNWFLRKPDGTFISPGAWGTIWEDLIELNHQNVALWDKLAQTLITWCERGVDGFRCDAGYKVPAPAWQYIVAKVQQEFPNVIFLLEGLGGAWEATDLLLSEGGMQWAYSELFQNYSGNDVSRYLDHSLQQNTRTGIMVNFSETHDNERLASIGKEWSLLRNRLCALTSASGAYGFACGVEWLATEKIRVHEKTDLRWGFQDNILSEIQAMNRLLTEHPCFFDDATLQRLSPPDSVGYILLRISQERKDICVVAVNLDTSKPTTVRIQLPPEVIQLCPALGDRADWEDLLGQPPPEILFEEPGTWLIHLGPGGAFCLSPHPRPVGMFGEAYRRARAQSAWGLAALADFANNGPIAWLPWEEVAKLVETDPAGFLAAAAPLLAKARSAKLSGTEMADICSEPRWRPVIHWSLIDKHRITPVPPDHWLLVEDASPFRATFSFEDPNAVPINVESVPVTNGHVACFRGRHSGKATLTLERYGEGEKQVRADLVFLPATPSVKTKNFDPSDLVLLTNGRGGMARLRVDLGGIRSKYDCVLGANLHPAVPVDRHIFVKRIRFWIIADGFNSPLDFQRLRSFHPGPPATWDFVANAGDGRTVEITISARMIEGENTVVFLCSRPTAAEASGKQLPAEADVRVVTRVDIEDRNFHTETHHNGGADHHFNSHLSAISPTDEASTAAGPRAVCGFRFTPAPDRQLRVWNSHGAYHSQPEWSHRIPHPVEQSRGHIGSGDAFSPGWFETPLGKGEAFEIVLSAETNTIVPATSEPPRTLESARPAEGTDEFETALLRALKAFVVKRGSGKTVIAGYPWFLDWGRDTFICARGLLAAGMREEVKQMTATFARFQSEGTLPNTIHGEDASNRDTSDAPLWFGLVCEEIAMLEGPAFYSMPIGQGRQTIGDTLREIGIYYAKGTPNGIRMDPGSGLVWSPSHFTWMDTNYPAATPREGYPVEIQALWIRLLAQLERIGGRTAREGWENLRAQALASVEKFFWSERLGWHGDVLSCRSGVPASAATLDTALRPNALFLMSLGLVQGERARRTTRAARRYLVVPGALRTLAPLPVEVPLPVFGNDGSVLNDPARPYWPRYEGDEDTRRKPAYHNGTAWTWTLPVFCEALARAWDFSPAATAAARAYLGSMAELMGTGCIGQLPELLDGDAPHYQRGCDAQAWAATEALRVWRILKHPVP
ncbi:MAG TPA: amylo-alpha-1,6-glucosidase, partial [Verrucomicrobiae bacterium]|nr:amylo-alpha-1,6-glucosidase [Verrucomicrobiae bacterium]